MTTLDWLILCALLKRMKGRPFSAGYDISGFCGGSLHDY